MASGYGIDGGVSRCFPYWQDLLSCYVLNTTAGGSSGSAASSLTAATAADTVGNKGGKRSSGDDGGDGGKWKCIPQRDDYFECLHHRKEITRTKAIGEAYGRYERAYLSKTGRQGEVKELGLLKK